MVVEIAYARVTYFNSFITSHSLEVCPEESVTQIVKSALFNSGYRPTAQWVLMPGFSATIDAPVEGKIIAHLTANIVSNQVGKLLSLAPSLNGFNWRQLCGIRANSSTIGTQLTVSTTVEFTVSPGSHTVRVRSTIPNINGYITFGGLVLNYIPYATSGYTVYNMCIKKQIKK
jgi:hypothetical protein